MNLPPRSDCFWCGADLPPGWRHWAGPCCQLKKAAAYEWLRAQGFVAYELRREFVERWCKNSPDDAIDYLLRLERIT